MGRKLAVASDGVPKSRHRWRSAIFAEVGQFIGLAVILLFAQLVEAGSYNPNFVNGIGAASLRSAAVLDGNSVRLTDNAFSSTGALVVNDLDPGRTVAGFVATFDLAIDPGSQPPADGVSVSFGVPPSVSGSFGERGTGTGLAIGFDIYHNAGETPVSPALRIWVNNQQVAAAGVDAFTNGTFRPVRVEYGSSGLTVSFDNQSAILNLALPSFTPAAGFRFTFGARTGSSSALQRIANVSITTIVVGPLISQVNPVIVPATNARQNFEINGSGFNAACTVTLRDLGTGEVFPNRTKVSQTSTQIVLNPNFTAAASRWSVEVINPGNVSSGQFLFNVGQPGPPGAQVTSLTVSAPPGVGGGTAVDLSAALHYSTGPSDDVSDGAAWSVTGGPSNTRMEGRTLRAEYTAVPMTAFVRASFERFNGTYVSDPVAITIAPALGVRIQVAPPVAIAGGTHWLARPAALATGGTGDVTPVWRWRGQEVPGYASPLGDILLPGPEGPGLLEVTVTDAAGKIGNASRSLVLNKPPAPNQPFPLHTDELDAATLLGVDGKTGPNLLSSRKTAGLLIIAHGLNDRVDQLDTGEGTAWVKRMAAAVETARTGTGDGPPNVVLVDWSRSADPSKYTGYNEEVDELSETLIELGIKTLILSPASGLLQISIGGFIGGASPVLRKVRDIRLIRGTANRLGEELADWIEGQIDLLRIDPSEPIHLIGHSAGGFLVARCASKLLERRAFDDLLVTTLDTPMLTLSDHINGVRGRDARFERYVTDLGNYANPVVGNAPDVRVGHDRLLVPVGIGRFSVGVPVYYPTVEAHPTYRVSYPSLSSTRCVGFFARHGEAHEWYIDTIADAENDRDGFWFSPFLGNTWASSPPTLVAVPPPPPIPDQPVGGFQTFGQVTQNAGAFTLTELNDAGIFTALAVPVGATSLKFRVRWDVVGDGDFLEVSFGDAALAVIDGYARLVGQWQEYEVPVNALAGEAATLVFRLASRGQSNAAVSVDGIALVVSDDPDGDGLTLAEEAQAGTDSRYFDSDGDGFSDGYEVLVAQTDPTRYDSDGDGLDDYLEREAGTSAMDHASTLAARVARLPGGGFEIRWSSVRGKSYRVLRSSTPGFEGYSIVGRRIVATGPTTVFTDPSISAGSVPRMFYKVAVEPLLTPLAGDGDFDGLTDAEEATRGTNAGSYDTDGDGIGDGEEVNLFNSSPLRADTDGDGASDWAEWVAGTNPTNPTSVLAITSIARNADGSVTLRWSGVAGRYYRVRRSLTPDFTSFQTVGTLPGLPPTTSFTDTGAAAIGGAALFYKVAVE